MDNEKRDVELGKFLSLILRHQPDVVGIRLDENGWANVEELLEGMNKAGNYITIKDLERIVENNDKNRYAFNDLHSKIRANQGHSIDVDMNFRSVNPPKILYHGTAKRFLESIKKDGIKKMSRQYVHLSYDKTTATCVGLRHGAAVVLVIDTLQMAEDGYKFYLSDNGVWLSDDIPYKYVVEELLPC